MAKAQMKIKRLIAEAQEAKNIAREELYHKIGVLDIQRKKIFI